MRSRAVIASQRATPFTPLSLSGVVVWVSSEDITPVSDNTVLTANWADRSGNGRDLVLTAAPKYRTTQGPNGGPSVEIGTSNGQGYYTMPASVGTAMNAAGAGEVFMLLRANSNAGNAAQFRIGTSGNSCHYHYQNNNQLYDDTLRNNRVGPITYSPMTDWRLYDTSCGGGTWTHRSNGTQQSTSGGVTFACLSQPLIGHGNAFNCLQGGFVEVLFYDRVLNSTERGQVNAYYASKYGLTIA